MDLRVLEGRIEKLEGMQRRLERVEALLHVAPQTGVARAEIAARELLETEWPVEVPSIPEAAVPAIAGRDTVGAEGFLSEPRSEEARARPVSAHRVSETPLIRRAARRDSRERSAPAATTKISAKPDLERFFGVAVLGRVGVAALLLAASYFAQLAYRGLSDTMRVASIYGLSALLIAAGFAVKARVPRLYLGLLWGGGVAAAYLAGVVAKMRYGLVGPFPATAMLVGACLLGQALAHLAKTQALALVALAGAFAAPMLTGALEPQPWPLLVYLLTLHGWAAFTEARFGWEGARVMALGGAASVFVSWTLAWGAPDAATILFLHLLLLGVATPECIDSLRGHVVSELRALGVSVLLVAGEVLGAALSLRSAAGSWTVHAPLISGAVWATLAVAVRARSRGPVPMSRIFARLGGALLVMGLVWSLPKLSLDVLTGQEAFLVSLAVVALAAVGSARWLGAGEGVALFAALLALLSTRVLPTDPWTLVALVPSLALLVGGRTTTFRGIGLVMAGAAPFLGPVWETHGPWPLGSAFAVSALIAVGARRGLLGRANGQLMSIGDVLLTLLAAGWIACSESGAFGPTTPMLANAGTSTAVFLMGCLAAGRASRPTGTRGELATGLAKAALVLLPMTAGWAEIHRATGGLTAVDLGRALDALFLAVGAAAIVMTAGRTRSTPIAVVGVAGLAWLAIRVALDTALPGRDWTAAMEIAAVALPAVLLPRLVPKDCCEVRAAAVPMLLAAATFWILFALAGRESSTAAVVLNARFAGGILVFACLVIEAARRSRTGAMATGRVLGLAAVLLGFGVGLAEVLDAVASLSSPEWKAALVSVYSTLYSAGVLAVGFRLQSAALRWVALGGFGLVIGKVALLDLAALETSTRILITGCLGVVLLLAAYAYARRERLAAERLDAGAP